MRWATQPGRGVVAADGVFLLSRSPAVVYHPLLDEVKALKFSQRMTLTKLAVIWLGIVLLGETVG